jgi:hypothetical protein
LRESPHLWRRARVAPLWSVRRWGTGAPAVLLLRTTITLVVVCWLGAHSADIPAIAIDLDADTDHTGFVEHSAIEDELEDRDGQAGVIVLPNWDDDDPLGSPGHGTPDCLVENRFAKAAFPNRADRFDNAINGAADRDEDMQVLSIRRIPDLPPGWTILMRTSPEDAENLRVFDEAGRAVIVPTQAAGFLNHKSQESNWQHAIANVRGSAGQFLNYYVEGISPGARFRIELVAFDGTRERAKDVVRGRVAPFLMASNERPVRQVVTPDFRGVPPPFRMTLLPGLTLEPDTVRAEMAKMAHVTTAPPTDTFWQDGLQAGYATAPGPGQLRTMILLARFPKEASNFVHPASQPAIPRDIAEKARATHWLWPNRDSDFFAQPGGTAHPALLGPGVGIFEMPELPAAEARSPTNHGGNLEVTWPMAVHPFGRLVVGMQMSAVYREFLRRQEVQTPLLELDLEFLFVKHVDEVVYFLPGNRVAMPSPDLGHKLLSEYYRAHSDPAKALFLKGREVTRGRLTDVRRVGRELILTDAASNLDAVEAGMYLHIYRGKGRSQTYDVLRASQHSIAVEQEAAELFSYWRRNPAEIPAAGSEYIIAEQPLHDTRARVLLVTISELLDTTIPKVREFWQQNASAAGFIAKVIRPEVNKLVVEPSEVSSDSGRLSQNPILELPVLFHQEESSVAWGLTAFTPNLVNGHLVGDTFLMSKAFALRTNFGQDVFEQAARQMLAQAGLNARFADSYFLFHNLFGEIHCGPNLILEPPRSHPSWWKWPAVRRSGR